EDDLDVAERAVGGLVDQHLRPDVEWNERDAEGLEASLERGRDHAARPRTPAEALDRDAATATSALHGGDLVEHLIGHRVVDLPTVARARRVRREEAEEAQVVIAGDGE